MEEVATYMWRRGLEDLKEGLKGACADPLEVQSKCIWTHRVLKLSLDLLLESDANQRYHLLDAGVILQVGSTNEYNYI